MALKEPQENIDRKKILPQRRAFFQKKLAINSPGDKYEQEADRVATEVVNSEKFFKPQISPILNRSAQKDKLEVPKSLENNLQQNTQTGSVLPQGIRASMESEFGVDFSGVKIHHDSEAEQASKILNANAFTYGNHIYFNPKKFNPNSKAGKELVAHELTHVVQQGAAPKMEIQRDDDETVSPGPEEETEFEFDYDLLPPSIQFSLGQWMLEANTSQVALQFTQGLMRTRFGYNYGGNLTLGTGSPSGSTELGFNPHSPAMSFGLTQDRFRFGANADFTTGGFGFNLGYGSRLLPMPFDLAGPVNAGWAGASGILGDIGNMQDPISFYQNHGDNIDEIMGAVKALQPLANEENQGFGVGLRFTYNPQTGALFHAGAQWMF
ncbi:DUF4157 domain-containing protein [Algoriphagus sp. D3-2-R+10]|uniref:eCIS core domain-containing protein n=1 Tax=Algoriphagus aurantiacus TaxID=3103948 RepID=UPI002B3A79F0|nr:DUF4157 domain-containing protein [Algoriphagus sp. D3-2-R+10]MEB2773760.1 DUF4157 domain-containing protein [Algoriphagus sp. D3-2-R+10]